MKLAEAKKLRNEFEKKLRDIFVAFSNYGPGISVCMTKQMHEAKELAEKLEKLNCEVENVR